MAVKTPKQRVADGFGSRSDIVAAIAKITGADKAEQSRLMGTTNKKLLRIHETAKIVHDKFGGKKELIEAIATKKFVATKASDDWRKKMSGFTIKRLLEVHRQVK